MKLGRETRGSLPLLSVCHAAFSPKVNVASPEVAHTVDNALFPRGRSPDMSAALKAVCVRSEMSSSESAATSLRSGGHSSTVSLPCTLENKNGTPCICRDLSASTSKTSRRKKGRKERI